ncbi:MAG: MFS transporter [Anaerolineae bacterium]|nr:MFS transporter [Anaerolineae bacterium]
MARPDYSAVIMAYISFIILGVPGAVIGVLWLPHIQTEFNQPLEALGLLLLTVTAGYFAGSSFSGRLFARYSVGVMLAVSMLIAAVGFAGYLLAPSWEVVVLWGLVTGFGTGVLDGGMNIYFAAHFNARLMNWLHASFGVGSLLAPQLVNQLVLAQGQDWRRVYLVLLVLYAGMALIFFVTRARWRPVHPEAVDRPVASLRQTLRLPLVLVGVVIFAAYAGAEAGAGVWGAPLFQSRGIETAVANNFITAYWLSFTLGRIIVGTFVTAFVPRHLIRACMVGAAIGTGLLVLHPFPGADLAGLVLFGFTLSPVFAVLVTATQERLGAVYAPNAIGLQVAAASLGAGGLPSFAGQLSGWFGLEVIPVFLLALVLIMLIGYQLSLAPLFDLKKQKLA